MATLESTHASCNKLFILGTREYTEEEVQDAFSKYGNITKIYKVTNRDGSDRGIMYVIFEKISSAALALEEMHGKTLLGKSRTLKINYSQDRDKKSDEPIRLNRIYIKVPKNTGESDLRNAFETYGNITNLYIGKNSKGELKDFGFITFENDYQGAIAVENCPSEYKAIFANPKPRHDRHGDGNVGMKRLHSSSYMMDHMPPMGPPLKKSNYFHTDHTEHSAMDHMPYRANQSSDITSFNELDHYPNNGVSLLEASVPNDVLPETVEQLFDIIPGMESCDRNQSTGYYLVRYSTPQFAAYAKDKLNGFQMLPGIVIAVRYADLRIDDLARSIGDMTKHGQTSENLHSLVQSVQSAAEVLKQAGLSNIFGGRKGGERSMSHSRMMDHQQSSGSYRHSDVSTGSKVAYFNLAQEPRYPVKYMDINLPGLKPLHPPIEHTERLFVVTQPERVDQRCLSDCFVRFGNFIRFDYIPSRNYGYAHFASRDSAQAVIDTIHCREIDGNTVKIMKARDKDGINEEFNIGQPFIENGIEMTRTTYCNFALPTGKPMAPGNAEMVKRLFITSAPTMPVDVLIDVFSRFGDLIFVSFIKGKNYGFAKYASVESADAALECLHNKTVAGSSLKIFPARPKDEEEN